MFFKGLPNTLKKSMIYNLTVNAFLTDKKFSSLAKLGVEAVPLNIEQPVILKSSKLKNIALDNSATSNTVVSFNKLYISVLKFIKIYC